MGIGFECLTKSLESVLDMVGSGVGEGRKEREWGPNVGQLIYYMYEGPVAFGTDNANRANMCHCVISGSLSKPYLSKHRGGFPLNNVQVLGLGPAYLWQVQGSLTHSLGSRK
jgi:hypothetical protein